MAALNGHIQNLNPLERVVMESGRFTDLAQQSNVGNTI